MAEFVVSIEAISDLESIFENGLSLFGEAQAERYQRELFGRFELLADFPGIAGPALPINPANLYRFPFGSHVIIFTLIPDGVRIVRIFHARMDWLSRLTEFGGEEKS